MSSGINTTPEQAGHGNPFLSFSTVFENYFLPEVLDELMCSSEIEQKKYSIKKGDIFLTRTSETLDELAMSSVAVKDYPEATFSGFLKRLRPTQSHITYYKYMAFYLRGYLFRKSMNYKAVMTLRASLNEKIFSYIDVFLPPFSQQKAIGDFLYRIEEIIRLNRKINNELEGMAKLIFDYWFIQFDFPDLNKKASLKGGLHFVGKPYKSSGGKMIYNKSLKREIPENWRVVELGSILRQVNESIEPHEYTELEYLPIEKLPIRQLYYDNYEVRTKAQSSLIRFKEDDILLGAMRVYFHRVCIAIEDGISRSTIMALRPWEKVYKNFSLLTLNRNEAIEFANNNSSGTSIPYAKWNSSLERFKICIPPDDELLVEFNKIIEPIINRLKVLSRENLYLSNLKEWLLPMVINGEVIERKLVEKPELKIAAEPKVDYG